MKRAIYVLFLTAIALISFFNAKTQTGPKPKPKPPSWVGIPIGSTKEGVSPELMSEYSTIVSKYGDTAERWWTKFEKNISAEDRDRLEQIFKQMSADQQAKQRVAFIEAVPPLKKVIPSNQQFSAWKNENVYGVWIDGKKIKNSILKNYNNTDFEQVTVSKLYGAAKKNKKYSYQVNLMTKDYYRKHYEKTAAKNGSQMVFRS